jgi:hypothetical protein
MRALGPINAQFICINYVPYLIELNTRFGGGMTFTMEAGLDMIKWMEYGGKFDPNFIAKPLELVRTVRDHYFHE